MKMFMRKGVALFVGALTITAVAGLAQAETRFAVQDAAGTVDKMVVTDTGRIGLGTTTPTARLEMIDAPGVSRLIVQTIGTSSAGGGAFMGLHNNGTIDAPTLPVAGDRLGFHLFGSKIGTTNWTTGGFQVYAEGTWTPSSMPTYFVFETAKVNTTSKYERLRIAASGNIGINANAPQQRLEVGGGIRLNPAATKSEPTANTKPDCSGANPDVATKVRGTIWYTQGPNGFDDYLQVCKKDAAGNYAWTNLF